MDWLDPLVLSRWQFGLTTVYHYLFVPLTIGMAAVAAIFQTMWVRTAKVEYLHLTRFLWEDLPHQLRDGRRPPASCRSSSSE